MTRIDANGMISRGSRNSAHAESDTFTPDGSGANSGYACHTIVAAKDYTFTEYPNVNRRWTGTPDRRPKGTPLIGES